MLRFFDSEYVAFQLLKIKTTESFLVNSSGQRERLSYLGEFSKLLLDQVMICGNWQGSMITGPTR